MFEPKSENVPSAPNLYSGLSVDLSALQQAEANVPDEWQVGQSIVDLYNVEADIGQGGFGQVYKVLHTGWNISLAVKTPKIDKLTEKEVENFIREAETWVKLGLHPHIVTCFYVRKLGKSPRVFAEFVGGGSLHDWIYSKDGEIPRLYQGGQAESFRRILDIAIQFAWGLHYAHEQGLIHQDVKPGNTMMTTDGTVKVTDFGLARGKPVVVSVTEVLPDQTLQVEGSGSTPAYRSPEQARGDNLTRRTDLYSWALSVLEIFKGGRRWRTGEMVTQERQFYLNLEPEHDYIPPMRESVGQLLWVCLREDPERRPRTMLDVANTLKAIYQQETGEVYPRPEPETGKDIADTLNNRAVSLLDLGQLEAAMHLWDKALEVNPLHPESTYNRGLILWRSCRITDDILVKDLEKVRDANIGNWNAHYLLALVHLERNNCEEAIKSLNQIPVDQVQQLEVQSALRLAQERLPNSNRFEKELIEWGIASAVMSVCITPDGQYGLSTFYEAPKDDSTESLRAFWENHKFYMWDLKTGRASKSLKLLGSYNPTIGNALSFRSLSLSRDGHYVLVTGNASITGSAYHQLWDIKQGKFITAFKVTALGSEQQHEISRVGHLSADDRFVISGNYDGTLEVWDIKTGKLQGTFTGHDGWVNAIDSAPETKFILSGSNDKTLKLWDTATGNCLHTFSDHTSAVQSICLSADGLYALSGSSDNTLKLWDTSTGECLRTFIGHTESVQSVCLSPNSKFALSGSFDATLRLWDVVTGRCLHTFIGHEKGILSICLSADGRTALSGSGDTTIRMWSVGYPSTPYFAPIRLCQVIDTEKLITNNRVYQQTLNLAKDALAQGDMLTYAQHIAKALTIPGYERNTELLKSWTQLYSYFPRTSLKAVWEGDIFSAHESAVTSICFSYDGKLVLSGDTSGQLLLWDIDSKQVIRQFQGHGSGRVEAYLSQDSKQILSGSFDRTLKLWNVETGQCVRTFEGHTDRVTSVRWTSNNSYALSSSNDGTIRLWEVKTGRCLRVNSNHKNKVYTICLSPDELYILSAKSQVKVWRTSTGYYETSYSTYLSSAYTTGIHSVSNIHSMEFSPDTKYLLIGGEDERLELWEVETGRLLHTLKGHNKTVVKVCFSPDGKYALSVSLDMTVRLWEIPIGQCLRIIEGFIDKPLSASFSPDMRYILTGSGDGQIKIWLLDWELGKYQPDQIPQKVRGYIDAFLQQSTPYTGNLPLDREPTQEEVIKALTKEGKIVYDEQAFQSLLIRLYHAGYGLEVGNCQNITELLLKLEFRLPPSFLTEETNNDLVVNFLQISENLSVYSPLEFYVQKGDSKLQDIFGIAKFINLILFGLLVMRFWSFISSLPWWVNLISLLLLPIFLDPLTFLILLICKYTVKIFTDCSLLLLNPILNFLHDVPMHKLSFWLSYLLSLSTMTSLWNFAWWRAFFLSIIPAIIISELMGRFLDGKTWEMRERKSAFWILYLLLLITIKYYFDFTIIMSLWLSIIPAILLSTLFIKIFYKFVKPTR